MKRIDKGYIAYWVFVIVLAFTNTSCKTFLDEKPTKGSSVVIKTAADLNAVLNNYADFYEERDNVVIFGSDDNGFSADLYAAQPYGFSASVIQFSLWDVPYLPQTDQSDFAGRNFWSNEYSKIFVANLVLANLDEVSGSAEEKAMLNADAHFIRAYSYWQLANTYCLPYTDANKNEPGLPLQSKPDYEVNPRSSLAATYQQIEADLAEALKTPVPLVQNGIARNWRTNVAAVNGFAARYYLNQNNYAKALEHANASLAHYNVLIDYNTGMQYGNPVTVTVDGQPVVINFPYTRNRPIGADPTDVIGWKETLYHRVLINPTNWYIPSQDLLNQYDQAKDLRYKYHYVQNYSYTRGLTQVSYPGYVFFWTDGLPEGPTVAEMVLIKAECLARNGVVGDAMTTVNQLYSHRTLPGTEPLAASSQNEAIAVVLQERRRELPFRQRWFDIRRFNQNDDPNDDVVLSKTFYPYSGNGVSADQPLQTYSLPKGSRRFASPLPQTEVTNSNGAILPNTY